MTDLGITYINFVYCELVGKWEKINEEIRSDLDIYEALEDNAQINVRMFDGKKDKLHYEKRHQHIHF